jgi:hypothetical protein
MNQDKMSARWIFCISQGKTSRGVGVIGCLRGPARYPYHSIPCGWPTPGQHNHRHQRVGHPQGEFDFLVTKILKLLYGLPTPDRPLGRLEVGQPQGVELGSKVWQVMLCWGVHDSQNPSSYAPAPHFYFLLSFLVPSKTRQAAFGLL